MDTRPTSRPTRSHGGTPMRIGVPVCVKWRWDHPGAEKSAIFDEKRGYARQCEGKLRDTGLRPSGWNLSLSLPMGLRPSGVAHFVRSCHPDDSGDAIPRTPWRFESLRMIYGKSLLATSHSQLATAPMGDTGLEPVTSRV